MIFFVLLVIFLLFVVIVGLLVFYFHTQHSLRSLTKRVDLLQPQVLLRTPNAIRLERAGHQDRLVLMEAELNQSPRAALLENEMIILEESRDAIKLTNEELKRNGEWIGIPFDFEWAEFLLRLPTLKALYAKSLEGEFKDEVQQ